MKAPAATPLYVPTPEPEEQKSWRKARYISVAEAVRRLQPHVDVPVVLPLLGISGWFPSLKRWMADPKYVDRERVRGQHIGTLNLIKGNQMLIFNYGLAQFDGCGGDAAIETNVLGQPALIYMSPSAVWTQLIWPVRSNGTTGRYGITGTFEGWQMIQLAESMELARIAATNVPKHC